MLPYFAKTLRMFEFKQIWTSFKEGLTFGTLFKKAGIAIANLIVAALA